MTNQKPIYDLHAEHTVWLNKLSFYKDELVIMQNRIEEISARNTSKEVLAMTDHFQNQLFIQKERISEIKHAIKKDEAIIEVSVLNNPTAADHRKSDDHTEHRDQMNRFEEIFSDLKKELMGFLSKTM